MIPPLELRLESAKSTSATALIAALDAEILARYPGLPVNGIEPDFDDRGGVFAVGYAGGEAAACGAFREVEGAAEIKRMFVAPPFRRLGYARTMLAFLETEAARKGFRRAILETGTGQPEAVGLYKSAGWKPIPRYGPYVDEPVSLCFGKTLVAPEG